MNPNRNIPPPLSVSTLNVIKKTNNNYYASKAKAKWTTKSRQKYNLVLNSILIARTWNVKVEAKIMRTLMLLTSLESEFIMELLILYPAHNLIVNWGRFFPRLKLAPGKVVSIVKIYIESVWQKCVSYWPVVGISLNPIDKKCVSYLIDQNEIST